MHYLILENEFIGKKLCLMDLMSGLLYNDPDNIV